MKNRPVERPAALGDQVVIATVKDGKPLSPADGFAMSITGEDSLKGKKLGAQLGTTGESLAQGIDGATTKSYDQIGLAIQDLLNGQLDAVICDTPIANSYVSKNSSALKIVGNALTTENYGIAVAKGKNDLLNKINQGLAAVKAKETIDTLVTKWLTS